MDYPAYYNLKTIFEEAKSLSISIYVMIDEYDNFKNELDILRKFLKGINHE